MTTPTLGVLVHDFFLDHLVEQKGLRQGSVRSYRDTLRLFLPFVAADAHRPISRLQLEDLCLERVLAFLRHMEQERHNCVPTRNQRLAALRTFFEYLGHRAPEALHICQQVAVIPTKRTPLPETHFLDRDQVQSLFASLPDSGRLALRDRALLLFLYNTGARVQEVADLRVEHLALDQPFHVRLHGKGGKWRQCPLWQETAAQLARLIEQRRAPDPQAAVFLSATGHPLTRFGIYKRVRQLTAHLETAGTAGHSHRVTPHVWRHTAAVHLLEAGVDVNVIRGWLGHVSLNSTNRYAEITMRMKTEAMKLCAPQSSDTGGSRPALWQNDASLLEWLKDL
ncbi:MAG: tyrosine-type recombinase/integrase [Actinomycetota bacterium]